MVNNKLSDEQNRADILAEFVDCIPPHIEKQDHGVFRSEREWKHMAFAMADAIEQLRTQLAAVTAERDELREQGQHLLFAMSPELWETLKKAEADIKAGRVHNISDIIQELTQQEASDNE